MFVQELGRGRPSFSGRDLMLTSDLSFHLLTASELHNRGFMETYVVLTACVQSPEPGPGPGLKQVLNGGVFLKNKCNTSTLLSVRQLVSAAKWLKRASD